MSKNLILVLNCGSSSLKGAVLDNDNGEVLLSCLGEKLTTPDAYITFKKDGQKHRVELADRHDHTGAVGALLDELKKYGLDADLEACIPLAPLHNPANLTGIRAAQAIFAGLPNVAVFDTAFHQTMPEHAYTYAVPRALYKKYAFRRYGFHGTSFRFVAPEAARIIGKDVKDCRLVIAHLGNGASITAVKNGESQDTSMGFTPLEGLVMGTRSGDVDAGIYPFLAANAGMSVEEVSDLLNKKSGLLGISELSNDCRIVEEAAAEGHEGAKLAMAVTAYRLAKYIAAMAVAAGGIDALVFTGGIGENSDAVRAQTVAHLALLGLKLDEQANTDVRFGKEGIISPKGQTPAVVVVPTNEELMIAHDTAALSGL